MNETQNTATKILRCPAKVVLNNTTVLNAQMMNISVRGATMVLTRQISPGQPGVVEFDMLSEFSRRHLKIKAKAAYCICIGITGFRVWMQFTELDNDSKNALTEYVRLH